MILKAPQPFCCSSSCNLAKNIAQQINSFLYQSLPVQENFHSHPLMPTLKESQQDFVTTSPTTCLSKKVQDLTMLLRTHSTPTFKVVTSYEAEKYPRFPPSKPSYGRLLAKRDSTECSVKYSRAMQRPRLLDVQLVSHCVPRDEHCETACSYCC